MLLLIKQIRINSYSATYIISGNAGVAGANLSYEDGTAKTANSNTNGDYSFVVSYSWPGDVTIAKWDIPCACKPELC
jgi:hypothetical protein